ncbi:hypothetical protein CBP51_00290 [Cellvibrio mixtus]|uniref:Uncharacterized protein n=2 Tax=Cellvibrionaceae TaxID=1706371 RepID=A0A266Q6L7_9GAMM|nr:hypothetical protein B0D95_05155 [Cellvibrio sp. PSBB023]OZY85527.1 hypothetical protein CBP51_00290 [Cellvibrio mixtus]
MIVQLERVLNETLKHLIHVGVTMKIPTQKNNKILTELVIGAVIVILMKGMFLLGVSATKQQWAPPLIEFNQQQ